MEKFLLFRILPVCMGVLMQQADSQSGGNSNAGARLVNGDGDMIAEVPGAKKPLQKGTLGDPIAFSCVSAHRLESWKPSATAPDLLKAEVGTVTFELAHGGKVTGRIIKHQTRTVEEGGRIVGKGKLELTFAQNFAKTKPAIEITAEGQEWADNICRQWQHYRDENRYPVVLLVKPANNVAAGSSVED